MSVFSIEGISAAPGERAFGYIECSKTVSQIPIHIPVNIVNGAEDGPTLLVSAAVHGAEIIGTLGLGKVLRELDESKLRGTLIAAPVGNTSAFEFGTRTTYWDGQNMNRAWDMADPKGSPTAQLQHAYITKLVARADAHIDIHSGSTDSYVWYTIYSSQRGTPETIARSKNMAIAFGLEQIFRTTPIRWRGGKAKADEDPTKEDPRSKIPRITPEIGGGADFLKDGQRQMAMCAEGIFNVMRLMDMIDGDITHESDKIQIVDAHDEEIWAGPDHAGIMLLDCERGDFLTKGDAYASVYHPFTGQKMAEIPAPSTGIVLNTGVVWPVVSQGKWLGVLGEVVEEVSLDTVDLKW